MKLLSALVLVLFFQFSFATTYYISPNGNDKTGNGSIGNPWQTLSKATSSVTAVGDIIHVNAGTYIEAVRCNLAVGVSIEGDGVTSVIQSTLSQQFFAIIVATSPEGTNGNQHISNIKLDGTNRTTSWGIEIRGRSNFSIHDCTIVDFEETGIHFAGRADNSNEAPGVYATGNSFYNNTVANCAKYDGYGRGCLAIGGQQGMLIYNNNISQTGRAKGTNGWPIKYCNDGFLKGCKIYNNTITKEAYDGTSWDFSMELFNVSGTEIYKNSIIGSLDLPHLTKEGYAYSVYIHDNIMGPATLQSRIETGITMEYEVESAIIENNQLRNLAIPIYFTPRDGSLISDIIIKNNTCENIGVANGSHGGAAINFSPDGAEDFIISNFLVEGNKFIANEKDAPFYGVGILSAAAATNIKIQSNTIKNFSVACILANPASVIDTLFILKNSLSGNGNNNKPLFTRGMPANYTNKDNIISGPGGSFNFRQQIIRPLYYELKYINLLELIAAFAGIIGFLFCRRENIYTFPMALISAAIYIFLSFDHGYPGTGIIYGCFMLMGIYGWVIWSKRDRKKHRIVRVTSSSQKDLLMQVAVFAAAFAISFAAFVFYKDLFPAGTIPWASALATATAFTGMWLITRKKVQAWHWWIAACIISIPLYFISYQLFMSLYYCAVLPVTIFCLYAWKRRRVSRRRSSRQ